MTNNVMTGRQNFFIREHKLRKTDTGTEKPEHQDNQAKIKVSSRALVQ